MTRKRKRSVGYWAVRFIPALLLATAAAGAGTAAIWIASTPGADQKRPSVFPFVQMLPQVANIAHRGASGRAVENSLAAFELALQAGAHVLELDVRQLRDGVLVVAHDSDLLRVLGLPTVLREVTWPQLRKLKVGEGQVLPGRLTALLQRFPRALFNIEIKDGGQRAAQRLAAVLVEAGAASRVLVASMHHEALVELRQLTGGRVATSASGREVLRFYLGYRLGYDAPTPFGALQLPPMPRLGFDSQQFLRYSHSRGVLVHFWTIDEEQEQRRLIAAGADGIMSNYPAVVAKTLSQLADSPKN